MTFKTAGRKAFYDPVAELYDKTFSDITVRRAEWRWINKNLPPGKIGILDIGCGNGGLLRELAPQIEMGTGVDVSKSLINIAEKKSSGYKNLCFTLLSGPVLPFEKDAFDAVISMLSFRYLDWKNIFKEILRVLKPGGCLLILDMVKEPLKWYRVPAFLKDKAALLLLWLYKPEYKKFLMQMVNTPAWKKMLNHHPIRCINEYKSFFKQILPGRNIRHLNSGWKSSVIAVNSGPLYTYHFPDTAILDWGIGGLGFYKLFKQQYPGREVLYFSDSGSRPYGKVSHGNLIKRLSEITAFLKYRGVNKLIIACNALSTVLESIKEHKKFRITGVIKPTVRFVKEQGYTHIGVIGGKRTIKSGCYPGGLKGMDVKQVITQPLSAFIERGDLDSAILLTYLDRILAPLKGSEALILGCTHYPAAGKQISMRLRDTGLIDPARITLEWVMKNWSFGPPGEKKDCTDLFLTTGNAQKMRLAGSLAFDVNINLITRLDTNFKFIPGESG